MKVVVSGAVIVGVALLVTPASAEESPRQVKTSDTRRGYAYTFDDDPLDATPQDARGARISVRPIGKRTLLIRPRAHFIRELFKSAEDL